MNWWDGWHAQLGSSWGMSPTGYSAASLPSSSSSSSSSSPSSRVSRMTPSSGTILANDDLPFLLSFHFFTVQGTWALQTKVYILICAFSSQITHWGFYYKANFITINYIIDWSNYFKITLNSNWLRTCVYYYMHVHMYNNLSFKFRRGSWVVNHKKS